MKKLISLVAIATLFVIAGCSTTASFKVPAGTKLVIRDISVPDSELSEYKRTPFFWDVSAGIPYRLEKDGQTVREGKLKSHFRVASIFWPPFSLIYWPMRFDGPYDLTTVNSKVIPGREVVAPAATAPVEAAPAMKAKKKKK